MNQSDDKIPGLFRRWSRGYAKIRRAADWDQFAGADWQDRIMDVVLTDDFHAKQGRSTGRWVLTDAHGKTLSVYLKRHFVLPRMTGLLSALFPRRARSPGLEEWNHVVWAADQGLPVPRPVAAGEWLRPHGRLQSFFVVEELVGMKGLHQAVPAAFRTLSATDFHRWKRGLAVELARISEAFHGRKAFHKDWYFCHCYIDEADTRSVPESWVGRVRVIDLHRLQRHPVTAWWRRVKDLAQLWYSSHEPGVTDRDRLRFWSLYRRAVPASGLLLRLARMKLRLYLRHNAPKG